MTAGIDSKILTRLEEWEKREGPLPRSLEFYQKLLRIQLEAKASTGVPKLDLSREVISKRMMAGHPLLEFGDLSIDWSLLRDIFKRVGALVSSYAEVPAEAPVNLNDSIASLAFLQEVTKVWFTGAQLSPWVVASGANEALLEFLVHAAFKPILASHGEAWLSVVNQESWRRSYCPICGGGPDFAFLDKERGARWLLCSRCDAEWPFQRLECPCCGSQDQNTLAYFTDDKGLYRVYVCERCRHYLKAIDLRQAEYDVLLPLERFLTLDLDTQAHQEGYSPGIGPRQGERQSGVPLSL